MWCGVLDRDNKIRKSEFHGAYQYCLTDKERNNLDCLFIPINMETPQFEIFANQNKILTNANSMEDPPGARHRKRKLQDAHVSKRFKPDEMDGKETEQVEMEESEEPVETPAADAGVSAVEPQVLPPIQYEYLDHTADIQIHAWGATLSEAFEQAAMGMFGYITDIERVDNFGTERIEASGHDLLSLLYGFLDEWLFVFNADPYFVARKITITHFDGVNFKIAATGYGETFDLSKHTQGTEVKAITYSNMQVHENDGHAEVFVIVDI